MRNELKKIGKDERHTFTATVGRYGYKRNFGHDSPTLLVKDIKNENYEIITDHLWLNYGKSIKKLDQLWAGDIIQFNARVSKYGKGYHGDDYLKQMDHPIQKDYRLSYPSKFKLIYQVPNKHREVMPEENWQCCEYIRTLSAYYYEKRDLEQQARRKKLGYDHEY